MAEKTMDGVLQNVLEKLKPEVSASMGEEQMVTIMEWLNENDNYKRNEEILWNNIQNYLVEGKELPKDMDSDVIHINQNISNKTRDTVVDDVIANLSPDVTEKLNMENLSTLQIWLDFNDNYQNKSQEDVMTVAVDLIRDGKEPAEMKEYYQIVDTKTEMIINRLSELFEEEKKVKIEEAKKEGKKIDESDKEVKIEDILTDKKRRDIKDWVGTDKGWTVDADEVAPTILEYVTDKRKNIPSYFTMPMNIQENEIKDKEETGITENGVSEKLLKVLQNVYGEEITEDKIKEFVKIKVPGNDIDGNGFLPFAVKTAGLAAENPEVELFDLHKIEDVVCLYNATIGVYQDYMNQIEESAKNLGADYDEALFSKYKLISYIANDYCAVDQDNKQISDLYELGKSTVMTNVVIPEVKKYLEHNAQTMAVGHFSKIDTSFENLPEEQRKEKLEIIKANPKEVLALSLIHEKNKEEHKDGVKIFNQEDLKAKLELPEVKELASKIDIKDLTGSLKKLGKDVRSIDGLNKNKGKSIDINSSLIQTKQNEDKRVS